LIQELKSQSPKVLFQHIFYLPIPQL